MNKGSHFDEFDKEWSDLGKEICQAIYTNPRTQEIKHAFQKNGFLTLEEKSEFINICDKIKYDIIYATYGDENSAGYKKFSDNWKEWFQQKGVGSSQNRGQRNSVEHILFGSTPDPAQFLLHFEHEMMGSMKPEKKPINTDKAD
jgi:hypothetical protein